MFIMYSFVSEDDPCFQIVISCGRFGYHGLTGNYRISCQIHLEFHYNLNAN